MILISFCWLSTIHTLYDFFEALKFIKPLNRITLIFLKWIQNIRLEFSLFYQSLSLRFISKRKNILKRFLILKLITIAAINRIFNNIGKMTYTGESHIISHEMELEQVSINLKNVTVSDTENIIILNDISLKISPGEFLFVAGSDCSGKTTLLQVIAGYVPKIEGNIIKGEVLISGISMKKLKLVEIASEIKLFTNYSDDLFIGLNVGQEIMSFTENIEMAKELLHEIGLLKYWDTETIFLSGGEKIKLLFACAYISNAKVLLFDSPLSQIDPLSRPIFIDLLKKLNKKGKTIVIADNQYIFYDELVSRFILLEHGRIKEELDTKLFEKSELIKKAQPIEINLKSLSGFPNSENNLLVELENIELQMNDKIILHTLSLKIFSNECIIVLGSNGSGKTSLMLTISGIYSPTNKNHKIKRECNVGMVFQNPDCQILEVTVEKEIGIGPTLNGWSKLDRAEFIRESQPWVNAELNTQTMDLHLSQTRMLAAVSTNLLTQIMIFDEPTLNIDNSNINNIIRYFNYLTTCGTSVIIVTHDLRIIDLASRFLVLENGNIIEDTQSKYIALKHITK